MNRSLNKWMILFVGVWLSTPVFAETPSGPCQEDIQKFCPDVPKGREMGKCLAGHRAELSPSCQGKYKDMKDRVRQAMDACRDDAEKFCSNRGRAERPVARALKNCLKNHEAELSKACKDSIGNKNRKRK